jgi:hemolysin D
MKFVRGLGALLARAMAAAERGVGVILGLRDSKSPDHVDVQFLPAALEIVAEPPSPVGRAVGATIIILFSVALAWASLGKIDVVVTAPGKIVASGGTKLIQPFETSIIKAIDVHDGQRVKVGDPLIELDSTITNAEMAHLRNDLLASLLDVARLKAALVEEGDPLAGFQPPEGVNASLLQLQRQLLLDQLTEQRIKLLALDRQRIQKEAERTTITATIEKLQAIIPFIEQRVDIRKGLADKELGSKITYLEIVQQLNESRYELTVQRKRYEEATAALAAVVENRAQAVAEYRRTRSAELAEADRKSIGLREDLIKAEQRSRQQTLLAPVDGIVQQLSVHTIGGVVTPAQSLLALVPVNSQLEIEARISNRDIGFVSAGAPAQIKIDTFNFTRYGLRHGVLLSVSSDAIVQDKPGDRTQPGGPGGSSEPSDQALIYSARVSLDKTKMQVDDNIVDLTPGMAVTVEISIGSRTVMSYLLSPLLKYAHDSLREK